MTRSRDRVPDHPAEVYRDSLSRGSYWAVHHALTTMVDLLGGGDPWTYSWEELRYADTARVRARLVERYAPATVNKMLTVLRGVLKTCWRLGLMDAETYRRVADVANVRAKTLPTGRALEADEVRALFEVCAGDASPAGRRDAGVFAILYGAGLRRAELCGLDVADFDEADCSLTVRAGKGRRDRQVFLTGGACRLVKAWIKVRGSEEGPLFCPVDATGGVRVSRLRGEAVRYILQKRQQQAGVQGITPHDFRRYAESQIMPSSQDALR